MFALATLTLLFPAFFRRALRPICTQVGATALHAAAFYGHLEVTQALLEAGAKPNVTNHVRAQYVPARPHACEWLST